MLTRHGTNGVVGFVNQQLSSGRSSGYRNKAIGLKANVSEGVARPEVALKTIATRLQVNVTFGRSSRSLSRCCSLGGGSRRQIISLAPYRRGLRAGFDLRNAFAGLLHVGQGCNGDDV